MNKIPLYLYFDTVTGSPRTNRAPNQPVQRYVNLKVLWHKPDEVPSARKGIIVYNNDEDIRTMQLTDAACRSWTSLAEFAHIQAWMYIEDLYRTIPFNETEK